MADALERIVKVTVDGSEAVRALQRIAQSTDAVDSKMEAFAGTVKKAAAALAGAFAVHTLVERVRELSESFDQLGKDAAKVGVGAEDLQRLRYAADLAGVSAEKMDKALTTLSSSLATLSTGTDEATRLLKDIGVTGTDSATAALGKIADRFKSLPDGIEKTAEAVALFGKKVGPDLIPLLNGGAQELAKLEAELDKFGGVIDQKTIDAAERFNDNLSKMGKTTAGAAAQLTAGLLPALDAVAGTFVELVTTGDGFKSTGEAVGEVFITLTKGAIYASQILRTFGKDIAFVFSLLTPGLDIGELWDAFQADIRQTDAETKKLVDDLTTGLAAAKAGADERTEAHKKERLALAELAKAEEARKKAAEEAQQAAREAARREAEAQRETYQTLVKLQKDLLADAEKLADVNRLNKEAIDAFNRSTEKQAAATLQVGAAYRQVEEDAKAFIKTQEDEQLRWDALRDLYEKSTGAIKDWAATQLAMGVTVKKTTEDISEQQKILNVFGSGFDRFVDALSTGTVTVAQAFQGMVQSIIADLLKLLAKKYILDAFAAAIGFKPSAQGNAFVEGQTVATFAQGGVLPGRTMMPMALMGEAGPEAVLPLKRTADGALGVRAQGSALNVAIHNYAAAQVSARRDSNGDLQVIIEQTKRAVATDIRRGGNDVSRALDAAYRLTRGHAAPF